MRVREWLCLFLVGVNCTFGVASICKKPNPNSGLCHDPGLDAVSGCQGLTQENCGTKGIFEIKNFPLGRVNDDDRKTAELLDDCYRVKSCVWLNEVGCTAGAFGPWNMKAKIVDDGLCK